MELHAEKSDALKFPWEPTDGEAVCAFWWVGIPTMSRLLELIWLPKLLSLKRLSGCVIPLLGLEQRDFPGIPTSGRSWSTEFLHSGKPIKVNW